MRSKTTFLNALLILFGLSWIQTPASAKQNDVQCGITIHSGNKNENYLNIDIQLTNTADKDFHVAWSANSKKLLMTGLITIEVRDGQNNIYRYIPPPGPVIVLSQEDYILLKQNDTISARFNICQLSDHNNSKNPCNQAGRYTISAVYQNKTGEYWSKETNSLKPVVNSWKGSVTCQQAVFKTIK